MNKAFIILTIVAIAIGCDTQNNNENKPLEQNEAISDPAEKAARDSIEKAQKDSTLKVNEAQRLEDIKRRDALKKKFNYKVDEFKDIGFYIHKNQTVSNSWNRKCLKVHINSTGYIYLEDQFYSDDWIFHTSIQVKIGADIYNSSIVETYDENNKTEIGSGSIWENITYSNEQDEKIITAIAENSDKEIKVRFNGKQYYSDINLSKKDKQAIKEGYELSELIKKVGNE